MTRAPTDQSRSPTGASAPLLRLRGVQTHFSTKRGVARVLDGLDLEVPRGLVTGLVGESGSGKSVTAYSVLRLVRKPGEIVAGEALFDGRDLLALDERVMARVRGGQISMIFQHARASLNPVFRIQESLLHVLRVHRGLRGASAIREARDVLGRVGLPDAGAVLRSYPHALSGGMCQRVMIALALSCKPRLLLADEPTTALDVTVQYQIIQLLKDLREREGLTQLLITHDLGVVAEICDEVNVMYAGEIVEHAPVDALFDHASHPYTRGLLRSRPRTRASTSLHAIPGRVPDLVQPPSGCRFHPRCAYSRERCKIESPQPEEVRPGHWVRCHFWREAT